MISAYFDTHTKICAICLGTMKPGNGHAIFTAECSHMFHFHCITSNVKHGKQCCPICRAKWKEIPFQSAATDKSHGIAWANDLPSQYDSWMQRPSPSPRGAINQQVASPFLPAEHAVFNDDDEVSSPQSSVTSNNSSANGTQNGHLTGVINIQTYPEVPAVPKSISHINFSSLIHLKAPIATVQQHSEIDGEGFPLFPQASHALDLVTVIDISASMAGTKLALVKRAMGFVIQNLGPSDRLSVVAFSSTARRLFPLHRMSNSGRHEALVAVNSLISNGGTNIAEGLRMGTKVLLDKHTINRPGGNNRTNYQSLLPVSMQSDSPYCFHIHVHTFGIGADHDADAMHLIAQSSSGTFSFIEAETVIQDAFAQCIGGLLSVIVQEVKLEVECIDPAVCLTSITARSSKTTLADDRRKGFVEIGDLYAEEERDFLITTDIPANNSCNKTSVVNVKCVYKHTFSKNIVTLDSASRVIIERPETTGPMAVSMEVDRQRNRSDAMAEGRAAAEQGDFTSAASILQECCRQLSETASAQAGDRLCVALDVELRQMKERMANQHVYERSGRAYLLSGLCSLSWQRATARGDSTESTSLVQSYQTPSMVDMVNLSQTLVFGSTSPLTQQTMRQAPSFPADSAEVNFFNERSSKSSI